MATTGPGQWVVQGSSQAWATAGSQNSVALNLGWVFDQQLGSTGGWTTNAGPTSSGYIFQSSGDGTTGTGNGMWASGRQVRIHQSGSTVYSFVASASFAAGITTVNMSSAAATAALTTGAAFTDAAAFIPFFGVAPVPSGDNTIDNGDNTRMWANIFARNWRASAGNDQIINLQSNRDLIFQKAGTEQGRFVSASTRFQLGTNPAQSGVLALPFGTAAAPSITQRNSGNTADENVWPLTTATTALAADVAFSTGAGGTYNDGPALALSAGTWLISGAVLVTSPVANNTLTAKLWDGVTLLASAEALPGGSIQTPLPLSGIASSSSTWKISAAAVTASTGNVMKASALSNGSPAKASTLVAIKIG